MHSPTSSKPYFLESCITIGTLCFLVCMFLYTLFTQGKHPLNTEWQKTLIISVHPVLLDELHRIQLEEKRQIQAGILRWIDIQEASSKVATTYRKPLQEAETIVEIIYQASETTEVPFNTLLSLVATESSFNINAQSWYGAIGLAQVVPRYWSEFCGLDLTDPRDNVLCGALVLTEYKRQCDRNNARNPWVCALKKYNVGPGNYYSNNQEMVSAMNRYITKINKNMSLLSVASPVY